MNIIRRTLALVTIALSSNVLAADKALIIGVGDYQYVPKPYVKKYDPDLPGIDLDVINFKKTVKRFGVQEQNIKVLRDSDVTIDNVKQVTKSFFSDIKSDDKVFFYFSGHGAQIEDLNGDEKEDRLDEYLVMYDHHPDDLRRAAFLDEDLNKLLLTIPSDNVYVFIDACHSGSVATKSLKMAPKSVGAVGTAKPKFINNKLRAKTKGTKSQMRGTGVDGAGFSDGFNFVSLSAAQDGELALATTQGSMFTLGIEEAVADAIQSGSSITPTFLHKEAVSYVYEKNTSDDPFTPQLTGNKELFDKAIRMRVVEGQGENWSTLYTMAQNGKRLVFNSDREIYELDQTKIYTADIPAKGYLNIISVDANDNATVVFPNKYQTNNLVKPGRITFDPAKLKFRFFAQKPLGKSLEIAIFSTKELNLFETASSGRNNNTGEVMKTVVSLSASGLSLATKGTGVEEYNNEVYYGIVETNAVTELPERTVIGGNRDE